MRQTKPFTVEIKPSRKLKSADGKKASIWGKMDLRVDDENLVASPQDEETVTVEGGDRR